MLIKKYAWVSYPIVNPDVGFFVQVTRQVVFSEVKNVLAAILKGSRSVGDALYGGWRTSCIRLLGNDAENVQHQLLKATTGHPDELRAIKEMAPLQAHNRHCRN